MFTYIISLSLDSLICSTKKLPWLELAYYLDNNFDHLHTQKNILVASYTTLVHNLDNISLLAKNVHFMDFSTSLIGPKGREIYSNMSKD